MAPRPVFAERQIWPATCGCVSGILAHMLRAEDGVHGGFWTGDDFVGMLSGTRGTIVSES